MNGSTWTSLRRHAADLRIRFSDLVRAANKTRRMGKDREAIGRNPSGDPSEPQDIRVPADTLQPRFSGRREIRWSLGTDWFFAVGALHALLAISLGALLSPWWIAVCGASFALKTVRARPGEAYLLIAFDDRIEVRRRGAVLRLAGACWMTQRWLVIPTARRVLPVRRGRLSAQDFARLRRAASG